MPIRAQVVLGNGMPQQPTAGMGTPCSPRTAKLVLSSANGSQLAISGSDTATATDAGILNAERVIARADTGTGTDAGALTVKRVITGSDVGTAADAGSIAAKRVVAGADTGTAADVGALNAKRALGGNDTGTGTDTGALGAGAPQPPPIVGGSGPAGSPTYELDHEAREAVKAKKGKLRRRSTDPRRDMVALSSRAIEEASAITESDVVRAQSAWNDDAPDEWVNLLHASVP